MATLVGKRVLITGASSGLGAMTALQVAAQGAIPILTARNGRRLRAVSSEIRKQGCEVSSIVADLSSAAQCHDLVKTIQRRHGGVDVLVNNAAEYWTGPDLIDVDVNHWDHMLATNLKAPFLLVRGVAPQMIKQRDGRIINVISATNHVRGIGPFRISKIGLEVLTSTLARELISLGVSTTAINPDWCRSNHSLSGPPPVAAARWVVDLMTRPKREINGVFFDLKWRNGKSRLQKRRRRAGTYGF